MICQKEMSIVVTRDKGPCFYWRYGNWMHLLNSQEGGECHIMHSPHFIFDEALLARTASVIVPRYIGEQYMGIRRLAQLKKKLQFDIVLDYDDLLFSVDGRDTIPEYNRYKCDTIKANEAIRKILPDIDRVLVSTGYLAFAFGHEFPEAVGKIHVLPNFAFTSLAFDLPKPKRKRPLVLYPGAANHFKEGYCGDIRDPWHSSLQGLVEDKVIDLHAFGEAPGPLPKGTVLHGYVSTSMWLPVLSRMAPDIIIAPLASNPFNKAKSPLKALEASLVGAAFVGSVFNDSPYNGFIKPGYEVKESDADWQVMGVFRELCDRKAREDAAEFTASQVVNRGLVAETKPATDHFLKCCFGRFLEIV